MKISQGFGINLLTSLRIWKELVEFNGETMGAHKCHSDHSDKKKSSDTDENQTHSQHHGVCRWALVIVLTWLHSCPHMAADSTLSPPSNAWMGCPRGVMVKALDCRIVVCEFILQSRYYVHFQANTLGKGMSPLILPAMG